jgi:hypothetical protein
MVLLEMRGVGTRMAMDIGTPDSGPSLTIVYHAEQSHSYLTISCHKGDNMEGKDQGRSPIEG